LLVDVESGNTAKVQEKELTKGKKLLRKRAEGIDDAIQWLTKNPDCLVELTMVTDTFLTALERKQINAAHHGIVAIVPEVKNVSELNKGNRKGIDITKSMQELFVDYFMHEKGQEPNEDILKLFTEILAEEEEL